MRAAVIGTICGLIVALLIRAPEQDPTSPGKGAKSMTREELIELVNGLEKQLDAIKPDLGPAAMFEAVTHCRRRILIAKMPND